jgi:hypothetical protein
MRRSVLGGSIAGLAISAASQYALADITGVSSYAQGLQQSEAEVGYLSPLAAIYSDTNGEAFGDSAPVSGFSPGASGGDPPTPASAGTLSPGYAQSSANAYGSVSQIGEISGDTLNASLVSSSFGELQAVVAHISAGGDPSNLFAQSDGVVSTLNNLTFTVAVPSELTLGGTLTAAGSSFSSVTMLSGVAVTLYQLVLAKGPYDETGQTVMEVSFDSFIAPGTYELTTSTNISPAIDETLSTSNGSYVQNGADATSGITIAVAPVPISSSLFLFGSGIIGLALGAFRRLLRDTRSRGLSIIGNGR